MKKIFTTTLLITSFLLVSIATAEENLAEKLAGKILLAVENNGEAYYVNPSDLKKYYLNRPNDAFNIMRELGIGISNNDLIKIPVGILDTGEDNDNDGLANNLEEAIGTNPNLKDTDNDGYSDKEEIENNYNPLGAGKQNINQKFTDSHLGKIFLATEKNGEAWYLNPSDLKRYYLGRPSDAFTVMKKLSLGITNENLDKILTGVVKKDIEIVTPTQNTIKNSNAEEVMSGAADAIRSGNTDETIKYFTDEMKKAIEYTMDFLDSEGRLILGNILSGAKAENSSETEVIYKNEVYFSLGGYNVPLKFYVEKQEDKTWKLTNL